MAEAAIDTGLLRVVSNAELDAAENAEAAKAAAAEEHDRPVLQGLAGHVMKAWESARDTKRDVVDRLLRAQRARLGEYTDQKLREIRSVGGAEEYARVTANKCRVAESWLRDVYLGQTEKPWTLKHTPNPALPPEDQQQIEKTIAREIAQVFATLQTSPPDSMVQGRRSELEDAVRERTREEARLAIDRMEDHMHDQLVEGGFDFEWAQFINDLVTYPAAHFKGPILRMRRTVEWVQEGRSWVPRAVDSVSPEFERIDPFRAFPSSNATNPQEGYFIEHVTYNRDDLYRLIGMEGFDEGSIRQVLEEYGRGGLVDWLGFHDLDTQEQALDGQDRDKGPLIDIDGLEYHGPVSGRDLIDWGMDKDQVPDPDADYEACVWLIGRWVIKAQLNYDPTRTRPYFKVCWEDIPGSYWGMGLVDALKDVQDVVNAAVRALVNNMSMASGPQVGVNVDRLPAGEDITTLTPWKIWQFQNNQYGSTEKALEFFQPNSNVNELLTVIEKFYQFADDWSLIPRYMSGNDRVGGAGRTASGLSMLLNAANKGLKGVVSSVDTQVLSPMLSKLYTHNMLFSEDNSIKGDAEVMARGAVSLMQLETLQLRRNEFLQVTNNPIDAQIVGVEGRTEILREIAKGLEMDVNRVVPRRPPQGQGGMPAQGPPQQGMQGSDEQLMNGAPVTDNFSPNDLGTAI